MLRGDGVPVIGLTLRHDRLDNFWFTLFHELMHVLLHLTSHAVKPESPSVFLDDLDVAPGASPVEEQADQAARDALVPATAWERSAVRYAIAPATVSQLALEIGVADAIVAGRVRHERKNFRLLSSMVGAGQVRGLFPELIWPTDSA
jgi:HTH-type transcriptional regulator/antitoxin HigA